MLHLYVTLQMLKSGAVDRVRSVGRDDGAIAIEYAVIAVFIALALIAGATAARNQIVLILGRIVPW